MGLELLFCRRWYLLFNFCTICPTLLLRSIPTSFREVLLIHYDHNGLLIMAFSTPDCSNGHKAYSSRPFILPQVIGSRGGNMSCIDLIRKLLKAEVLECASKRPRSPSESKRGWFECRACFLLQSDHGQHLRMRALSAHTAAEMRAETEKPASFVS